ncbi:T9SS type A sorting domain-containing protein [Candidatus Marinimicrobia bacterium MT.SAG.4]|nr:T9SS type A sorting domain-containing protein [Candidatus Marinimicrobia bacterium MT.SAG.4]
MKNLLRIIIMLLPVIVSAQNITKVEYFVDSDPGFGNGTSVSLSAGTDIELSFTADLSSLSDGFHVLYVRAKDTEGDWSVAMARPFLKADLTSEAPQNITQVEYYIDTDPGFGGGTSVSIIADTDLNLSITADLSSVSYGFHVLYVRAKDADGDWSVAMARPFLKADLTSEATPNISKIEYYIDSDPGFGSGTSVAFSSGTDLSLSFTADLSSMSDGFHILYTRAKDANGDWSVSTARPFFKSVLSTETPPNITSLEWFFEKDGVESSKFNKSDFTPSNDLTLDFSASLAALEENATYDLHLIAFDANGERSLETVHNFTTVAENTIPMNVKPIADVTIDEDFGEFTAAVLDTVFSEADMATGDSLLFSVSVNNGLITASLVGDTLKIFSVKDSVGTTQVIVIATDTSSATASDTFSVTINEINDAPIITGIPMIVLDEDTVFTFDLDDFVSDADDDNSDLAWTSEILSGGGGVSSGNNNSAILISSKDAPFENKKGLSKRSHVENTVENKIYDYGLRQVTKFNKKSVANSKPILENRNISVIYLLTETGAVVDSITITIDSLTHVATVTPAENFFAFDIPIVFNVADPEGASDSDTTDITVNPVNDPPIISALPAVVFNEDEFAVVHFSEWFDFVEDIDDADSVLGWSLESGAGDSVSFLVQGDSVVFEAPQDWFAFDRDTVTVNVTDGFIFDSILLAVHVMPVNDAPMFVDFPDTVEIVLGESDTLILSEFGFDIDDPDSVLIWSTFDCIGADSIACVTMNADTAIIQTIGEIAGFEELTFLVTDTSGASDTTSVIIYVKAPVGIVNEGIIPEEYSLSNNYPNPFNPQTTISYGLPKQSDLTLIIYNLMGQEIMRWDEQNSQPGFYQKIWNGRNKFGVPVGSGVYFYRIIAGDFVQTRKMVLLK